MFAKIFSQIYDGTLGGDWKALVTFQQMLVLSDEAGIIDMTPAAIHRVTGIPLDIIEHGVAKLSEPDPHSRSDAHEGRRIVLLDPDRSWGWTVVNKRYYRDLASREDKRRKDRERIAEKREKSNKSDMSLPVADCSGASPKVADVAHTNTNTNTNKSIVGHTPNTPPTSVEKPETKVNGYTAKAVEVLDFLNTKTGRKYRAHDGNGKPTANLRLVIDRLKTGVSVQDCKTMIARKHRDWSGDDKMRIYLRPSTLFRDRNFEQYLGECVAE